jgi:hypothetical protein
LPIWARHRDGKLEKVDDGDSDGLLLHHRTRFDALLPGSEWKLWRGGLKDEPKETTPVDERRPHTAGAVRGLPQRHRVGR